MIVHQISNSFGNYNYNAYIYTDTVWNLHFHGNYELIYTMEGTTEVTVNGVPERLEKGSFILVPPYTTHSLNISNGAKTWVGVFSKDYISDFAKKYRFACFGKFKCDKNSELFLTDNLFKVRNPERYTLISCLYLVCAQCVKSGKISARKDDTDFTEKVITYITEKLDGNVSMRETAIALNYEYHYFSFMFHKFFSMNFKRFINILRFEQACEMLSKKKYGITEISGRCGFESIRNFNRIFKEFSGITPSEYQKRLN